MLRAVARPLVNIVECWVPNALVFAIVLTFVVALLALGLMGLIRLGGHLKAVG